MTQGCEADGIASIRVVGRGAMWGQNLHGRSRGWGPGEATLEKVRSQEKTSIFL